MYEFTCSYRCSCGNRMEWRGSCETICVENELETMEVHGNGKCFRVILGTSEAGDFLCIPTHNAGVYAEDISDMASLEEHLKERLEEKDAVTIATALAHKRRKKN